MPLANSRGPHAHPCSHNYRKGRVDDRQGRPRVIIVVFSAAEASNKGPLL